MKFCAPMALFRPVALALILSTAATAAEAQNAAAAPPGARANSPAAAGPAAPAAAALPHAAGPTITVAAEEAALLSLIARLEANKPDYRALAPNVAQALRRRLPALSGRLAALGPVEGIDFLGEGPLGMKRFSVRYGEAVSEWALSLDRNGRVSGLSLGGQVFAAPPAAKPARAARRPK
jgi:hypothetical protein